MSIGTEEELRKERHRARNREYMRERRKDPAFREKLAKYLREFKKKPAYRKKHLDYMREYRRKRRKDPEYRKKQADILRERRKDPQVRKKCADYMRKRWKDPEYRKKQAKYLRDRCKTDLTFWCAHILRARFSKILLVVRGARKSAPATSLCGCSIEALKKYLESKFLPGMTWENRGEWHIDHIRPCASFDLRDPEQQRQCFHYTNLQPLWAVDNMKKGAKWNPEA